MLSVAEKWPYEQAAIRGVRFLDDTLFRVAVPDSSTNPFLPSFLFSDFLTSPPTYAVATLGREIYIFHQTRFPLADWQYEAVRNSATPAWEAMGTIDRAPYHEVASRALAFVSSVHEACETF